MTSLDESNPDLKKIEERLQLLEDKQVLAELLDEYCKAPDRRDFQGHGNCYLEDGQQQYGPWGPVKGRGNIVRTIDENENDIHSQLHYMTNMKFDVNGDQAMGTSYLIMVVVRDSEKPTDTLWQGGPYKWTFVRTKEQGWRIETMKLQATWMNKADPRGIFSTALKV